jgi:hypothetical protein
LKGELIMRKVLSLTLPGMFVFACLSVALLAGCASNVRFIQTDESYEPTKKPAGSTVSIHKGDIKRPYRVVGVIEAQLGKRARRPELDALLLKKGREIGVDAVVLVEYDVDREVYVERHHKVVGRGPWRHHVVKSRPRVAVEKTATGLAVLFE